MEIINRLLTNKIPRPGTPLDSVKAIVIHYPANAGQSASGVIKYWNDETNPVGSAHYVVDLNGDIYCAIPENEKAYHVGSTQLDPESGKIYTDMARDLFGKYASDPENASPNRCSLGIEMCNIADDGSYNQVTIDSAIEFIASLCNKYVLDPGTQVIRHIDVVGWKICPKWYAEHVNDFISFREAIRSKL